MSLPDLGLVDECSKKRTLTDVSCILEFAKLEASDLKPAVQCLYFSDHLENDCVKLLEMEEPVIAALQAGKRVEIRGDPADSAVLVTDTLTFDLREAETSNSLLLLPDLSMGPDLPELAENQIINRQVTSVIHNYYELRPIKPRLKKLRRLLEQNPYRGRECEGDELDTGQKYTFEELQASIQASDTEIKLGLVAMNACLIQGFWRLVEFEYMATVLYHVIQLCGERDWLDEGINMDECCHVLADLFPREVIEHLVVSYSKDGMDTERTRNIYHLCEDKVCKHFAELCLRNSGKFNLSDFLKAWQESVPEGFKTSLTQIEGMALVDREVRPEVIWYFSVDNLPEEVSERFELLFEEKKKWSLAEITPYVQDLTDDKTDVGALLTKFARASLHNGIKMFSSRKTS
ncbi:sister chromatid cohesion protein DCC1-like [Physella acuta]|uniref:sister chromatid cohesion protein DCC1-like n=1 Tax=Physella acuta TaxID=109671 RepID=UPI0027DE8D3F|nr:sister chromatid cohesion protein DCC1-like [Physella acuta]